MEKTQRCCRFTEILRAMSYAIEKIGEMSKMGISDFIVRHITNRVKSVLFTICIISVFILGLGSVILLGGYMSAIGQSTDSYYGTDVVDLGDFKKSYGKVEFDFYRDFEFLKDSDGSSTFIIDIKYPDDNWDRAKETGYATHFRINKKYSDYFGEQKSIKFTISDNLNNNYVAPLGTYKGYAAFYESTSDAPIDSRMLISKVYEFEFEIVDEQQYICTEGYKKCIGNTVYECVNNNFEAMQGCGYICEDDNQGNARCKVHEIVCGDGSCAPDENQLTCPEDCTPVCKYDDKRCENDRFQQVCTYNSYEGVYEWARIDDCYPEKCVTDFLGTPFCEDTRICDESETKCSTDKSAILVCKNNNWITETCEDDNILTIGKCEISKFGLGEAICTQTRTDTCDSANDCDDDNWVTVDKCDKSFVGSIFGGKGLCTHLDMTPIIIVLSLIFVTIIVIVLIMILILIFSRKKK